MATQKTYNASDIDTLEILEAIRSLPGMYLSSDGDEGVEVAFREVVDNAVDEHMNGSGDKIVITINPTTKIVSVEDYARGIPVERHPKHPKLSTLEVVLTKSHSGGKFGSGYGISGGLHGTGLKAVTATSSHLKATVWRDGEEHVIEFKDAKRVKDLVSTQLPKGVNRTRTGTKIEFKLDPNVFKNSTSTIPTHENVSRMLRERAYLNPGLSLHLRWGTDKEEIFYEKDGIGAYVLKMADDKTLFKKFAYFENDPSSDVKVAIAISWTNGYSRDNVQGFCNCVRQSEGGTHVQGIRMALPIVIRSYIEQNNLLMVKDKNLKIEGPDCFEGTISIVSVKHKSPVFKGQAKSSLSNGDVQGAVMKAINAEFARWLEENPKEAKVIASKAIAAAKARLAASKAREQVRKQDAGSFGLKNVAKLKDCSNKKAEEIELFIVEGDSAGGSASIGRDRINQAVYSLRGNSNCLI
jgi:DNA gyrase subunit B